MYKNFYGFYKYCEKKIVATFLFEQTSKRQLCAKIYLHALININIFKFRRTEVSPHAHLKR